MNSNRRSLNGLASAPFAHDSRSCIHVYTGMPPYLINRWKGLSVGLPV
jgi:hypothetical protein